MLAQTLLKRMAARIEQQVLETGDVDLNELASMLGLALAFEADRAALLLGLAEYLASALNGAPIQLDSWGIAEPLLRQRAL